MAWQSVRISVQVDLILAARRALAMLRLDAADFAGDFDLPPLLAARWRFSSSFSRFIKIYGASTLTESISHLPVVVSISKLES